MVDRVAPQLVSRGTRTVIAVRVGASARAQVAQALGLQALPLANKAAVSTFATCLWVRPDGWLVAAPKGARESMVDAIETALRPNDGAVVDISSSQVVLELSGAASRDVLASCCPLDVHSRSFATGDCAQSLIAKAPVLIHLLDDGPRWELYVRPTLAAYVTAWLNDPTRAGFSPM
jgi:sarcosine oxidase subunit gamma